MSTSNASAATEIDRGPTTEVDGRTVLLGSVCPTCTTHEFPPQTSCARCGAMMTATPLPTSGTVWSWTVQRIKPKRLKEPEFAPFVVGYVDLGPLKVETRFAGKDIGQWAIGQPVHLVTPASNDAPVPYWFEPTTASSGADS